MQKKFILHNKNVVPAILGEGALSSQKKICLEFYVYRSTRRNGELRDVK